MDKLKVKGGAQLSGEIYVSGAKNSALILFSAALLTEDEVILSNVPDLHDMQSMQELLESMGAKVAIKGTSGQMGSLNRSATISAKNITSLEAPYEIVRKMRASVLVLGPLLSRFGDVKVSLPGGCAIGVRPVDLHIKALEAMGACVTIENGYIHAKSNGKLHGADFTFEKVSVGATENALMAATLADGTTTLRNAACEPEIIDLAELLISMGAKISGHGSSVITIEGVSKLHGASHQIIGDRIEAGTFMVAAAITRGHLTIRNINPSYLKALIDILTDVGVKITTGIDFIVVDAKNTSLKGLKVDTSPYPKFPTDLQAQVMALTTVCEGESVISETIFENRFMHVPELSRLGAKIAINDNCATIHGVEKLYGAEVMATDLRASVCLVLAGLVAEGETLINRIYHLDRGYERIEEKLNACGANLKRLS